MSFVNEKYVFWTENKNVYSDEDPRDRFPLDRKYLDTILHHIFNFFNYSDFAL